jgi:hypothetical protein
MFRFVVLYYLCPNDRGAEIARFNLAIAVYENTFAGRATLWDGLWKDRVQGVAPPEHIEILGETLDAFFKGCSHCLNLELAFQNIKELFRDEIVSLSSPRDYSPRT